MIIGIIFIIILLILLNNNINLNNINIILINVNSEYSNEQINFSLNEYSIWSFLINIIISSIIGLWLYSNYLEYDYTYITFSLKLILFLFSVWLSISVNSLTMLLISWELIGFISFNLIWSWCTRSLTSSSAFSAIGFNRVGDILLVIFISYYILFIYSNLCNINNFILLFILMFKSVSFITYLWLPEAMEGPTPVSSLLHSCTLVMAGIFSLYNLECKFSIIIIILLLLSLTYCSLLARLETDFKRIIATSTIIMVGLLWYIIISSNSITSVLICVIHAIYKSGIFLTSGKLLSKINIYNDTLYLINSDKSYITLLGLFLIAHKTSSYGNIKHHLDIWLSLSIVDYYIQILIILNLIIFWYFTCKILNNNKYKLNTNNNDYSLFLMLLTLIFCSTIYYNSGYTQTSTIIILIIIFIYKNIRISLNIGSVIFNTSLFSINIIKFNYIKLLKLLKSNRNINNNSWILISLIILIILIYWIL